MSLMWCRPRCGLHQRPRQLPRYPISSPDCTFLLIFIDSRKQKCECASVVPKGDPQDPLKYRLPHIARTIADLLDRSRFIVFVCVRACVRVWACFFFNWGGGVSYSISTVPPHVTLWHCLTELSPNSKHWFTTSFLQPLPYLVTPYGPENCQLTSSFSLVLKQ